jgi:RimJ/RimL family protein N-acetyltransferase
MLVAAALCPAPPLLARELTGADPVVPELRQACLDAVAAVLDSQPDLVVVVGAAETAGRWDPAGQLDLSVFAPALPAPAPQVPPLPPALGLGAMLLDLAGYAGPRELLSVREDLPAGACANLGAQLTSQADRVALLVMADGSARRTLKAPGYLDERSAPFDAEVARIIAGTDLSPLLAVDAELAGELMATGRPAWQVLAGAAAGLRAATQIRYRDDPFGVAYLVAAMGFRAPPAVALRPLEDRDLDAIFEHMRDPQSVLMAAFTAADPDDRAAFDAHMAKVRAAPGVTNRAVTCDGELAGTIASFVVEGDTEVTYWIGRQWWGQGIATRALELLLELVPVRPLHARAASDNAASLRVLAKAGFVPVGREISYAPARGTQIEETILRKD